MSAFISYAYEDEYVVGLTAELFRFHGLGVWKSSEALRPGEQWRKQINEAITEAAALVVMVSKHAKSSKWVAREVSQALAFKPGVRIIPVRLDSTELREVDDDLGSYQAIDFRNSFLAGFRTLFEAFDVEFLSSGAILVPNRRREGERREISGRRISPIARRLKLGFWKSYQAEMGASKFEKVTSLAPALYKAVSILRSAEGDKFVFCDARGAAVSAAEAFGAAETLVYDAFTDATKHRNGLDRYARGAAEYHDSMPPIIYLVEALADALCITYTVQATDRRGLEGRRSSEKKSDE